MYLCVPVNDSCFIFLQYISIMNGLVMSKLKFADFNDMISTQNQVWTVAVSPSVTAANWQYTGNMTCECPFFFKNYICKHSMGVAKLLKFAEIPLEA